MSIAIDRPLNVDGMRVLHTGDRSAFIPRSAQPVAFELHKGALPDALYWDMDDPYYYIRLQPGPEDTDYLIAGGRDHKSGEVDDGEARFEALEAWR